MKIFIYLILLFNLSCFAEDDHHDHEHHHHEEENKKNKKSLSAHEHGVSVLNIVQDKDKIVFEFEMPGFDVVGFEYKAKKKEDVKKVKNALNTLSDYKNLIAIADKANCEKKESSAKVINEGSHSEFLSKYVLSCKNISSIKNIKIMFFDSFRFSKKLDINLVANNKKLSKMLDRENNNFKVEGYFKD